MIIICYLYFFCQEHTTLYCVKELKILLHMLHESDTPLDTEFSWIFIVVDVTELPSLPAHPPKHQCAINTIYVSQPLQRLRVIINQLEHYIHAIEKATINTNNF